MLPECRLDDKHYKLYDKHIKLYKVSGSRGRESFLRRYATSMGRRAKAVLSVSFR